MKIIINILFWLYKNVISPILIIIGLKKANNCRFYPTCSDYSKESFKKHGFLKGFYLSIRRILRCHPWSEGGIDNVPD